MSTTDVERLRSIKTFPSLVKYLRDELDWPIELDHFDDLEPITFDYEPEELGIDSKIAVKIKQIKRLRRLCPNQPWGVFFVNFVPKRLPVMVLRRILQQLVPRKRASASRASQQTWQPNDLLFVSAYGEDEQRQISFAHFGENKEMGDLPVLKVLGWDKDDTAFHLADAHEALKAKLKWPGDEDDIKTWRETWSSAFVLRHREVVDTSKKLAIELADLATNIRRRVNKVLVVEDPEKGPMRKLMAGFKEVLIHDLSEDDFADTYAQTIAYGLLAAAISRHVPGEELVLLADNIADMVPVTNPFLKELLGTFLTVGGRKKKLDFDELGINDIIDLLRNANLTAVLHDFGNQNPLEDPVIHFYELFLKEYDAEKRTRRGVFYTPKPVVSFIVRSVHEILKKDFSLEYGLADTTTWEEFSKHNKEIKIPDGVDPKEPFIQILDPATGTGTFLVEAIDVINKTMKTKWTKEGHMELEFPKLWNDYVPKYLLPRLYGFELLMAPYTIAHMKIGLKLKETGYRFQSSERARIYLTNTLEEPKDISGYFEQMAPALAHEAEAANTLKRHNATTVVIGNPPYAGVSANENDWIRNLLRTKLIDGACSYFEVDGAALGEQTSKWLNDDYVKFIRYSQYRLAESGAGIHAFITNHAYIDNPTFRGMRQSLMTSFNKITIEDLHGNSKKKEKCPDGSKDENVFDIQQGVAIGIFQKKQAPQKICQGELWGLRPEKYKYMLNNNTSSIDWTRIEPQPELYLFIQQEAELLVEYRQGTKITEIFPTNGVGMTTARDHVVIDYDKEPIVERATLFRNSKDSNAELCKKLKIPQKKSWDISRSRKLIQQENELEQFIQPLLYRPFDHRLIFYHDSLVWRTVKQIMCHMLAGENLGLLTSRQVASDFKHVFVSRSIANFNAISTAGRFGSGPLFPLYLYPVKGKLNFTVSDWPAGRDGRVPNLDKKFVERFAKNIGLEFVSDGKGNLKNTFGPENIFNYIYAVFHSPTYRKRYADFLKRDFPRVPITSDVDMFKKLCSLGSELVSVHLMESDRLNNRITTFPVDGDNSVTKVGETKKKLKDVEDGKSKLYINSTQYFDGLPEEVWNFHIGGYQVCYKWLYDRKKAGRKLSADDTEHYHKIVVAINETIKVMKQIDEVIDAHGGWPIK